MAADAGGVPRRGRHDVPQRPGTAGGRARHALRCQLHRCPRDRDDRRRTARRCCRSPSRSRERPREASSPSAIFDTVTGTTHLDVRSVPTGEVLATVASVDQPGIIVTSWADADHAQVFYTVDPGPVDAGCRVPPRRRSMGRATRSSRSRPLVPTSPCSANRPPTSRWTGPPSSSTPATTQRCRFQVVDTATGTSEPGRPRRRADLPDPRRRRWRRHRGDAAGLRAVSTSTATPTRCRSSPCPLDGERESGPRPRLDGRPGRRDTDGSSTRLRRHRRRAGDRRPVASTSRPATRRVLMTSTADAAVHGTGPTSGSRTAGSCSRRSRWATTRRRHSVDRAVPILIDLVTGERYEMVNLPH